MRQRRDHDFCFSRSYYTDTDPTSRERAATAGIEPRTSSQRVARSTDCAIPPPPPPPPPHTLREDLFLLVQSVGLGDNRSFRKVWRVQHSLSYVLSLFHFYFTWGRGSSVGRAHDSWWGGLGFDSRCGRPLPTGWVGVSIMWPAETEVMVSQLCLVCGST